MIVVCMDTRRRRVLVVSSSGTEPSRDGSMMMPPPITGAMIFGQIKSNSNRAKGGGNVWIDF